MEVRKAVSKFQSRKKIEKIKNLIKDKILKLKQKSFDLKSVALPWRSIYKTEDFDIKNQLTSS